MERITVFLNAHAGRQDAEIEARVEDAFRRAGREVVVRRLDRASFDADSAKAMKQAGAILVAGGGDGTINTVASAIIGSDATLGVLPLGTLNHFAKDLGIPLDLEKAARVIVSGRTARVDAGEVNGRTFVNNASIGIYARLVAERDARRRDGDAKWVAHGAAALRVWLAYRWLRVAIETRRTKRTVRTPFVFVGNNEYQLSGFELGGRRDLTGAHLHVCLAPGIGRAGVAWMIAAAMFGRIHTIDGFEAFQTNDVVLDANVRRLEASLDGEVVVLDTPLRFRIRPAALQVIVPHD